MVDVSDRPIIVLCFRVCHSCADEFYMYVGLGAKRAGSETRGERWRHWCQWFESPELDIGKGNTMHNAYY